VLEIHRSRINFSISIYEPLPYAILAFIMMFYPLSGFIADVCCGRLKTVVISLIILLLCLTILLIGMIIVETITATNINQALMFDKVQSVFIAVLGFLSLSRYFHYWPSRISGKFYSTWIRSTL
jgi:hypothetical protein